MSPHSTSLDATKDIRQIPLSYECTNSDASARALVFALFPEWEHDEGKLELIHFTDGITNTLLKAEKRRPGYTEEQVDSEAILLRAYGKGTELLIDRERETLSHSLLAQNDLAPPLLARFENGLLYNYIRGEVCKPGDLRRETIWRGVAQRLGEWHGVLPVVSAGESDRETTLAARAEVAARTYRESPRTQKAYLVSPGSIIPNLWSTLQKWIINLPEEKDTEKQRKGMLEQELVNLVIEFGNTPGLGKEGLVLGHCDLLSGNVIILSHDVEPDEDVTPVSFIDYEYATPVPAAFDIANHFAEWAGFECDYGALPTRSQRQAFIKEYLDSYVKVADPADFPTATESASTVRNLVRTESGLHVYARQLFQDVDNFRGLPGFYWGIWALIQATISHIDFDYAFYAELRLAEYFDWRAEKDGSRAASRRDMPAREKRWAQEE